MTMFQQVLASSSQAGAPRSVKMDLAVPSYSGSEDQQTPQDFLEALDRYRMAAQCSDIDLLRKVVPTALTGAALRWFHFMGNFDSLEVFKDEFRKEFEALNYQERLRLELKRRTQAVDEPLTSYIHVVAEYYRRLNVDSTESERVQTVLNQCHPSYRPFLHGKNFESLSALAKEAKIIQADLLSWHTYVPPPEASSCLEPSLAYKNPLSPTTGTAHSVVSEKQSGGVPGGPPPLGLAALDPFTHSRLERTRPSPRAGAPRLEQRQWTPASNARQNAPRRRCFECGSDTHLYRFCRQRSGNRQ